MKNGEMVKYLAHGLIVVKRDRGWFKRPEEFLMFPGDRLTQVPVKPKGRFRGLYLLWCRIAPEFWRRHKRQQRNNRE